jgi:hypothetical protein
VPAKKRCWTSSDAMLYLDIAYSDDDAADAQIRSEKS